MPSARSNFTSKQANLLRDTSAYVFWAARRLVLHFRTQICNQPISTNIAFCWNFALPAKTYAPKISGDTKASRNFRADEVRRRIRLSESVNFERKIDLLAKPIFKFELKFCAE